MYKGHEQVVYPSIHEASRDLIATRELQRGNELMFVDFGARHGEGLIEMQGYCSEYVFVEPVPRCVEKIRALMASWKGPEKLYLIDAILDYEPGELEILTFEGDDDQSSNAFTDRGGRYGDAIPVRVPIRTYDVFDQMFPGRRIDFAKINIEGWEYRMFEGDFFERVDAFVIELHNEHVPGKRWTDAIAVLEKDFDLTTYGDTGYKYCFVRGLRCG